ncbi:MAG: WxcM-like domain-containing protein [Victivallaceae bacterium]|nr:WxcM-like domain-containing protein [Victivallaceae bacterium]
MPADQEKHPLHPLALVERASAIGPGTRVGAWTHILDGARLGSGCEIGDYAFIDAGAALGNHVNIGCGARICGDVRIEDNAAIGPGAVIDGRHEPVRICRNSKVGANAIVLATAVGGGSEVTAGAVVTQNVPPYAIVEGNPARIIGYADAAQVVPCRIGCAAGKSATITGAKLYDIPKFSDLRGDLNVLEFDKLLPFPVKRVFYTYAVQSEVRGEHAHRKCEQFMVSVCGSVHVIVDNASSREEFVLASPSVGLYLPAGCWGVQYKHSADCVLMVLASHDYDSDDYIRDYEEFLKYKGR